METTRLHNISARSSRARVRAVWARHAASASFLASPYRDSVSTSWAAASPANSATFAGATPSSQRAVSPSSSTSPGTRPGLEPRPGRPLGRLLQPVEHRPAVRARRVQQALRPLPPLRAHPGDDARADRLVDLGTDVRRHLVQRGVRRELQRGLDDALQRHVDQVRRVVPHLRRLADRGRRQRPGPPRVAPCRLRTGTPGSATRTWRRSASSAAGTAALCSDRCYAYRPAGPGDRRPTACRSQGPRSRGRMRSGQRRC
jgi:hypothetical protein